MRVLVTGCAGFIGSHLTESLLADGIEVVGVDCFNNNYGRAQKLRNLQHFLKIDGFEFAPIDLARGDLTDLTMDCNVVFHLAAEPGVRSSWGGRFELYLRNNVLATQHLLDASCVLAGPRFVYVSSSSIYGEGSGVPTSEDVPPAPISPYGVTKLAGEHICDAYRRTHDLDTVIIRLFSVFGPRQRPDMAFNKFCRAALAREPLFLLGDGRQTRDFTYVDDAVRAIRAAGTTPKARGMTYNVGGGQRVSLIEAIAVLEQISGRQLQVKHQPSQHGDVRDTAADVSRLRDELGVRPTTTLKEGLAAEFAWMSDESDNLGAPTG